MTKHNTLRFFGAAFAITLLILLVPVTTGLAQRSAGRPDSVETWTSGPNLPNVLTRAVGVFFPANGRFYAMGGRSSDTQGSEYTNPFEYNPVSNVWTTKAAAYPDTIVNNMACAVLNDSGTDYIYCAGGSQVGTNLVTGRVFRYNPITDVITTVAGGDWPPGATTLPGSFTVFSNKLYILGGFGNPPTGDSTNQIWQFTPSPAAWVQKASVLPVALCYIPTTTIGNLIYTGGGASITAGTLTDTTDSYVYNPTADSITTISPIPRVTSNTRALNVNGQMWVLGGGFPTPSNEVDIYNPYCDTWSVGTQPFMTPRRNSPTDTNGGSRIWLAGGYANGVPDMTFEIYKAPAVTSAVSRLMHGGAGNFDIPLNPNGPAAEESRTGPNYQLVVTFASSVTVGSATVTCGTGTATFSGNGTSTITVNLTGVTDQQRITVTLFGVTDGTNAGDITLSMGILAGDTTANGAVNAGDVALTKSQVGLAVTSSNFREDVNHSGTITATDVAITKSDVGHSLPPQ